MTIFRRAPIRRIRAARSLCLTGSGRIRTGCTWGGSAIKEDIVAARGLFLEFGNHVITTRIQNVRVIPREQQRVI